MSLGTWQSPSPSDETCQLMTQRQDARPQTTRWEVARGLIPERSVRVFTRSYLTHDETGTRQPLNPNVVLSSPLAASSPVLTTPQGSMSSNFTSFSA
jgi:hypothetical protein